MTDLHLHEDGVQPLTVQEMKGIFTFERDIRDSGLVCCFDSFDLKQIRSHEKDHGREATQAMLREHADMLNTWYVALDQLLSDMLTCTTRATFYSTAAQRYIQAAADEYHQTRREFEHHVTAWSLGLAPGGTDGTYPPQTRGVNFLTQCLTNE